MSRGDAPSSVGDILEAFLHESGYDVVCKEWEVVSSWERIVGERLAEITECRSVENGVLYVRVTPATWRQELTYLKDSIKEEIFNVTGCNTIRDIVFS